MNISPLAPKELNEIFPVPGVCIATAEAGIKYKNRSDVLLVSLAEGSHVAGVFTKSKTSSASVRTSKDKLEAAHYQNIRGFIVNSGNSNAFTGKKGDEANDAMVTVAANIIGCHNHQVLSASTGVIGELLPVEKIAAQSSHLKSQITSENCNSTAAYMEAAKAIMTTDTFAKVDSVKTVINGKTITISGIAKGSGMIAPDMATMLSFIFTDANIEPQLLQLILGQVTHKTFNCITVDSDTSTSDTVLLAATGKSDSKVATTVEECHEFIGALTQLMQNLAIQIVKDGEGASKFITVNVKGATSEASAKVIAMAIANSPLVKTAIAGEDANWGRVIMAIGKAGEPADRDLIKVAMGGVLICADGQSVADYNEALVSEHLKGQDICIEVDLQLGSGQICVWTCDFTEKYIQINADYRS